MESFLLLKLYDIRDIAYVHFIKLCTVVIFIWIFNFNLQELAITFCRDKYIYKKSPGCLSKNCEQKCLFLYWQTPSMNTLIFDVFAKKNNVLLQSAAVIVRWITVVPDKWSSEASDSSQFNHPVEKNQNMYLSSLAHDYSPELLHLLSPLKQQKSG